MRILSLAIAGAAALLGTAHASVIDWRAPGYTYADSWTETADGITVTATGANFAGGWISGNSGVSYVYDNPFASLGRSGYGLNQSSHYGDSHYVEGEGLNDVVLFTFSETVTLTGAAFTFIDRDDDFVLFAGDTVSGWTAFTEADLWATASNGWVALDVVGQVFGIGARGANDDFKIAGLSFDAIPTPLPPAMAMFTAGGAAVAATRRRKAR